MSDSGSPDHNAAETSGYYQPPTASVDDVGSNARFYSTGPFKFTLLYLATFGLYGIYWSYKNWRFIRDRDNSDVLPFIRAFFYPLTFYWFLKSLAPSIESRWLSSTLVQVALSVIMLAVSMTSALPEPYVFISLLGFVVFLPVVIAMVAQAREKPVSAVRVPAFHWSNAFAYLVGIPFLLLIAASVIGVIPSSMVVSGDKLRDSDIAYLREAGILGEEEQILHFTRQRCFP
ncbi:MAG: hypothetical protein AAF660_10955 [Pseudomonadota bacterium]